MPKPTDVARAARMSVLCLVAAAGFSAPALGSPFEYLPVDDPLQRELRVLDTQDPGPLAGHLLLPHLGSRPFQRRALMGGPAGPADSLGAVRRVSVVRLERGLGHDATGDRARFGERAVEASTPRLFERGDAGDGGRFELSVGIEGGAATPRPRRPVTDEESSHWADGSGVHVRAAAAVDRWLAYSHVLAGHVTDARTFADPIVTDTDVIAHTEDTWLAYTGAHGWAARFGRSRWAWGPGDEGSLVLSSTMPAITGLELSVGLPVLGLRATILNATLAASGGEQLAAHRVEWASARGALRVGFSEAARYQASGWRALYAVGIVPYVLAQRLEVSDEPGASQELRNNVMLGADVSWRVADGTRVRGELLADDLHAKSAAYPNKLGWQVGLDGAGAIGGSRVTWNAEYTRLSRWVYTSYFGRAFAARGEPLGFPTGPDSRRVRVRLAWDPTPDWQCFASAARTDRGESGLRDPFVPDSGMDPSHPFDFLGVPERTREADAGVRWWPASGVDVAASVGWSRVEDVAHVTGRDREDWRGAFTVRLSR